MTIINGEIQDICEIQEIPNRLIRGWHVIELSRDHRQFVCVQPATQIVLGRVREKCVSVWQAKKMESEEKSLT